METNNSEKQTSTFSKLVEKTKNVLHKDKPEFTAEYAWIETTYGEGSYQPIEQRIKEKQQAIINMIKNKFPTRRDGYTVGNTGSSYRCFVSVEEDMLSVVDEIFEPFVKNGFNVINISERIEELSDANIYLITWKKPFKNETNQIKLRNSQQ